MTVKIRYEQIEQMTSSPKLYIPGINFYEKVVCFDQPRTLPVVITTLSLRILISDQNYVGRCAIPVAYLHTSHYGQKLIDFIWIKVKMFIFLLFGTSTVLFGTFFSGFLLN